MLACAIVVYVGYSRSGYICPPGEVIFKLSVLMSMSLEATHPMQLLNVSVVTCCALGFVIN